jgi:phospholipid/cholesterol/gamma-HCH transport system substrate-binding protein
MKFSIRYADKVVGALVILALAMLIVVVFMLGKSQRWFAKDFQYKSYFNSARGLSVNMAVQYKGFTIGHVKKIGLADDDMVEVRFTIFEEHNHRAREGSLVELQSSPIGLGNSFLFYPGKGTKLIDEGSVIPEISSPQAAYLIKTGMTDVPVNEDSIGNIINQITMLTETINKSLGKILGDAELAMGGVSDVVQNLSTQLTPILTNVETFTDQLAAPSGTAMSILDNNGPVYSSITEALNSITRIMGNLEKVIEFVPAQLPQVAILLSDLHTALVEAEKMIIALNNNPLLRGGVPEVKETGPGAAAPRDLDF